MSHPRAEVIPPLSAPLSSSRVIPPTDGEWSAGRMVAGSPCCRSSQAFQSRMHAGRAMRGREAGDPGEAGEPGRAGEPGEPGCAYAATPLAWRDRIQMVCQGMARICLRGEERIWGNSDRPRALSASFPAEVPFSDHSSLKQSRVVGHVLM
jgi:hypothetical protein